MTALTFKRAANLSRLSRELNAVPGVLVPIDDPIRPPDAMRALVTAAVDPVQGDITIYADDSLPQTVLDAISAAVAAHDPTPDPVPDAPNFGTDVPDNFAFQVATVVTQARAYLALANPTAAQTTAAVKVLVRLVLYLIKRGSIS